MCSQSLFTRVRVVYDGIITHTHTHTLLLTLWALSIVVNVKMRVFQRDCVCVKERESVREKDGDKERGHSRTLTVAEHRASDIEWCSEPIRSRETPVL